MYAYFIDSEYGVRQRALNKERDLSLRRFRELICPCMTTAKQRDTADEIDAEFKFCLLTWYIGMRKKVRNVRVEIEKCQFILHKKGSSTCESYTIASCPDRHRNSWRTYFVPRYNGKSSLLKLEVSKVHMRKKWQR
jgi:hypothetical protein